MPTLNQEGTTNGSKSLLNLLPFTRLPGSVITENKEIFSEKCYYVKNEKVELADQISDMQKGTILFGDDNEEKAKEEIDEFFKNNTNLDTFNTKVKVLDKDCLQVGFELKELTGRIPLVMNLAARESNHVCGKWWFPYMGTQEEFIERKSAIYRYSIDPALNQLMRDQLVKRIEDANNISHHVPRFGVIFTPNLPISRNYKETSDYGLLKEYQHLDIAACGAVDLRDKLFRKTDIHEYYEGKQFKKEKFINDSKLKIRMVLLTALKTNHKDIVLGAMGCGAYLNDVNVIAQCFDDVINEPQFANKFDHIYFAILGKHNADPFAKQFERMINNEQKEIGTEH